MTSQPNRYNANFTNRGNVSNQVGRDQIVNVNSSSESQDLLNTLPRVEEAAFDSYSLQHDPLCMDGTRVEILGQIDKWSDNPNEHRIFWLNGMAGTGKSTIARTVAQRLKKRGCLGATFFFSRGQGDRGHAKKFFTTLAQQFAEAIPALKDDIYEALTKCSGIAQKALYEQWSQLVFKPLKKLGEYQYRLQVVIILIDALDECDGDKDVQAILQIISKEMELNNIRLAIFITSRPETPIRLGFQNMDGILYRDLALHNVPKHIIKQDILVFLRGEMHKIRSDNRLFEGWPGERNIEILAERADGLFIYAATICRYIGNMHNLEGPEELLHLVLHKGSVGQSALNKIYTQVLINSIGKVEEDHKEKFCRNFQDIVGSIITLFDTLSVASLAELLSMRESIVKTILQFLHSLLNIPQDCKSPVKLLHPSFRDFLLDKGQCSDDSFWVDKERAHCNLAKKCLKLMVKTLKQNTCNLQTRGAAPDEAKSADGHHKIPAHVQYACLYWLDHLEQAGHTQQRDIGLHDDGQVHQFFQVHFLHWLEALSLTRKTSEGVLVITRLESMLKPDEHPALYAIVYDAKRFLLKNRSIVEEAPLQVYNSALVFSPKRSVIRNQYSGQFPRWIKKLGNIQDNWSSSLQTLEGHSGSVYVVAFSPDGKTVASGSDDRTVRLWDTATGVERGQFKGHSSWVQAVTFSSDGKTIASGSDDWTARLWDTATGVERGQLKSHFGPVHSVAFSPDGKTVASASAERAVRLWDTATGVERGQLKNHSDWVQAVAFSSDGKTVASGSDDKTVRLWDTATGAERGQLKGHSGSVHAVVFSPDGKTVASGSDDWTVRLWDTATGVERGQLEGHSGWVRAVDFSPDGKTIASGSTDQTVRLWNTATGAERGQLKGHCGSVHSVAFSPDGKTVASGSADQTVRLWDTATRAEQGQLKGRSDWVTAVTFSSDGKTVASGSDYQTVQLWDIATGAERDWLEGHSGPVHIIAFSHDGKTIASGSYQTVRLWDTATGAEQSQLKSHSDPVHAVAFSLDGKTVVSESDDQTAWLWDAATGVAGKQFDRHSLHVSVSTDGPYLETNSSRLQLAPMNSGYQAFSPWRIAGNWITWNTSKALWLPPEYRPTCFATHGNYFALGHRSGQISIFWLSSELPQM